MAKLTLPFYYKTRSLHLDHNQIDTLPKRILTMKRLSRLTITENPVELINPPLIAIYQQLTNKHFDLSGFGLFAIPEELFILPSAGQLESLNLSNNQLRSLPPDIECLTSLTTLNLSNNRIDALPWQLVCHKDEITLILSFSKGLLTNLRTLDLTGNPLSLIPDEIMAKPTNQILSFLHAQKVSVFNFKESI